MKERGVPRADPADIGIERAEAAVDTYIDAWNEPDTDRRRQLLDQVMSADALYVDPSKQLGTTVALVQGIAEAMTNDPGRRIVRTSDVDAHHFVCRFNWQLIQGDGTRGAESVDFVEFAADGKMWRVTGFFGPLAPHEPYGRART